MKKYLAWLLTIAMVLTLFPATVGATGSTGENAKDLALLEEEMRQALFAADDRKYSEDYVEPETDDPDEIVRVIVEMKAAPALQVASTAATVQALNAETAALKSQEATISAVRRKLDLEPVHRTGYLVNTVSYDIRRGDMEKLRSIPGVTNVTLAMKYEPELFSAKEMTDVYDAWKIGQNGYTGKGISIAIIDSGVNWQHQDMVQDPNAAKYTKTQMEELIAKLGHGKWFSDKVPFGHSMPREAPTAMYPQMMQEYCREHFVSKGMCCDFAIHDPDPPGHNPHCHIMLTMRAIDENGKWLPKSRKVYDLDENRERIRLPSGNWKSHKEDTVDWNEQYHAEEWRHGWELVQNKYLELAGSPERVDMRSYERQGLDKIPTVHMGAAVCALERKEIETNIGNLNRDIKAANRMMNAIRSTIRNLRNWIADIMEATKEVFAETDAQAKNTSPDLVLLLRDYLNLRKAERSDWSRYGQQKGTTDDLKAVSKAVIYLKEHELFTLEDLDTALQEMSEKSKSIHADMKKASARMKVITGIQNAVADCQTHKAVHDKYLKIGWKARQAAFAESHKDELDSFNKAFRYLKKQGVDLNVNLDSLQAEYSNLQETYAELAGQLATAKEELQPMKDIRYWVSKVLMPEQSEVEKKPEPKHSVTEKIKFLQEQSSNQQEQKSRQHKKQNMEL